MGAAARPAEAPAEPSTTTVESLLDETRARPPQREAGRTGKGGKGRKEKEELSGPVLQEKVMRLSIIIVIVIAVIGYVAGAVRSSAAGKGGLFDNGVFDIIGVFALGAALYLLVNAVRVGGKTKEVESQTEKSRLAYITLGGILLWLVPLVGSFGYNLGLVFQSSAMHPVYYVFVAVGVIAILVGLSGSKERSSFYKVFMFAVYGVVLATLPMAFPAFGNVLASDFWWSSTFIMISVGFVFIAFTLRQMRQGQYSQLDDVVAKADRAFAARQYDQAARFYSEAITLTHTLYSDSVFATRPYGDRRQVEVPEQYFKPWIGKAKCMALTGKLRKALAIYDLMLEVDQSNARVWHDRGRILVAEKRYAEAYISFDKAIKLDPTLDDARERRNEVLDVIRKMAD